MRRIVVDGRLGFIAVLWVAACGGSFTGDGRSGIGPDGGTGGASAGGASAGGASAGGASAGGASAGGVASGGVTAVGGASAAGGAVGAGGVPSAGGASASGGTVGTGAGTGSSGAAGSPIDCSVIGCGAPPACGQPCGAPCGCCPCADGQINGGSVCKGGCWAPLVDGGPTCDPIAEAHQRKYAATSPSQCAVIDFACPANTTAFQNACGCGCQQAATCPDWFDCMPAPGTPACNAAQIQTDCPYSGIAY